MNYNMDKFTQIYYALAVFMGIIAWTINPWLSFALWIMVVRCVFHEPVHYAAAKAMGVPVLEMVNTRHEAYIEVPEGNVKNGWVAFAGFAFDMVFCVLFFIAFYEIGMWEVGVLWFAFVILIESKPEGDLGQFYHTVVKRA